MSDAVYLYATDEDVAIRAPADFALICPVDQKVATGQDGTIESQDLWTLRSTSVDFLARGVSRGNVIQLLGPPARIRPPGDLLAIDAIEPGCVRLRRKGLAPGQGQPPSAPDGLTNVEFEISTLAPQVAWASYDLNRRFGIDDLVSGRRTSDLYDPREVRDAVVLLVLQQQYSTMSRGSGGDRDSFGLKAQAVRIELEELLSRVVLHWKNASKRPDSLGTSRFNTRLTR